MGGFAEPFDGDRLALWDAQRTAVGELKRPVDRCGDPILGVSVNQRKARTSERVLVS